MLSNLSNASYLASLEVEANAEPMEVMNLETAMPAQMEDQVIDAVSCCGTFGTLGTAGTCFGTFGTLGCAG